MSQCEIPDWIPATQRKHYAVLWASLTSGYGASSLTVEEADIECEKVFRKMLSVTASGRDRLDRKFANAIGTIRRDATS